MSVGRVPFICVNNLFILVTCAQADFKTVFNCTYILNFGDNNTLILTNYPFRYTYMMAMVARLGYA